VRQGANIYSQYLFGGAQTEKGLFDQQQPQQITTNNSNSNKKPQTISKHTRAARMLQGLFDLFDMARSGGGNSKCRDYCTEQKSKRANE